MEENFKFYFMIGPKEKKERALGERLHLKGERCNSPKCAAVRKPYKPGVHGPKKRMKTVSEFGRQIMEKQKFKLTYGLDEKGLKRLFNLAEKNVGSTSTRLLELLELRLDNVIYRAGLASSRLSAHQLIVHGHVLVNNKRVKSPAFQTRNNDVISFREESKKLKFFAGIKESLKKFEGPSWLLVDKEKAEARVIGLPSVDSILFEVNILVESFSK